LDGLDRPEAEPIRIKLAALDSDADDDTRSAGPTSLYEGPA
jgi:hypothetical protein